MNKLNAIQQSSNNVENKNFMKCHQEYDEMKSRLAGNKLHKFAEQAEQYATEFKEIFHPDPKL